MKVEDYDEYPEPVKEDDFQIPDIENNFEEGEEKPRHTAPRGGAKVKINVFKF